MSCEHRDDVAAMLLGGLPTEEVVRLDQHVLQCDECSAHRRELAIVRSLLDTLDPTVADDRPPAELGEAVVSRLVASGHRSRRRDVGMVLVGAAAALVLALAAVAIVPGLRSGGDEGQELTLASASVAPAAWGIVNLHPRVDGTIVDLEAGDLPTDGTPFRVTVSGPDGVLATQAFTVDPDGWGQVLLVTSRPMRDGDVIELSRDGDTPVPVLSCRCTV